MMTLQQVNWAMQHDWYVNASEGIISGRYMITVKNDMVSGSTLEFTDYEELRI